MVSSLELRPIIGYRDGPWHAILNAGVKVQLTGTNRHTDREPSAKVTYRAFERTAVGVEYYVEAGTQTGHAPPAGQQHLAVLVMDTQIGNARLNLGVGRGLTARSAGTVAKLIASFEVK